MIRYLLAGVLMLALLSSCGAGGATGGTETGNSTDKLAAAVTTIFGDQNKNAGLTKKSVPAQLLAMMVRDAYAQSERSTSACVENGHGGNDITMSSSITAGTYGISTNAVTVTAADGCVQGGQYLAFSISSHALSCTDSGGGATVVTMNDSFGIWRVNPVTLNSEIYGTFGIFSSTGSAANIKCSFTIDNSNGQDNGLEGSCEDSAGNGLTQTSGVTCTDA